MKKKTLFFLLIAITGINFQNCCTCPDIDGEFIDILGFDPIIIDNTGNQINEDEIINKESFDHFRINFEVDYVQIENNTFNIRLGLIPSAYGCDCNYNGENGTKEEMLNRIIVITEYDYNDDFKKGDTINELIEIQKNFNDDYVTLENLHNQVPQLIYFEQFKLRPTILPELDSNFQLRINLNLSEFENYEEVTKRIIFK